MDYSSLLCPPKRGYWAQKPSKQESDEEDEETAASEKGDKRGMKKVMKKAMKSKKAMASQEDKKKGLTKEQMAKLEAMKRIREKHQFWNRFDEKYDNMVKDMHEKVKNKMLEIIREDSKIVTLTNVLPVYFSSFDERTITKLLKTEANVITYSKSEFVDLKKWEVGLKLQLKKSGSQTIIFLTDTNCWKLSQPHQTTRFMDIIRGYLEMYPGLACVLNFSVLFDDDASFRHHNVKQLLNCRFDQRSFTTTKPQDYLFSIQTFVVKRAEFAQRLIDLLIEEPSLDMDEDTVAWLHERAMTRMVWESKMDCKYLFQKSLTQRMKVHQYIASKKKKGKEPDASENENDDKEVYNLFDCIKEMPKNGPKTVDTYLRHLKQLGDFKAAAEKHMDELEVIYKYAITSTPNSALTKWYIMKMLRNKEVPNVQALEKDWKNIKAKLKLSNQLAIDAWYSKTMKNLQFKPCLEPVHKNVFTTSMTQRDMTDEADRLKRLASATGSTQMKQLGQLYRWHEVNGKKVCIPDDGSRTPNTPPASRPDFKIAESTFDVFATLFGFVHGSSNAEALYDKSTYERVLHATPKTDVDPDDAAGLRISPLGADFPSASNFKVPRINVTPPDQMRPFSPVNYSGPRPEPASSSRRFIEESPIRRQGLKFDDPEPEERSKKRHCLSDRSLRDCAPSWWGKRPMENNDASLDMNLGRTSHDPASSSNQVDGIDDDEERAPAPSAPPVHFVLASGDVLSSQAGKTTTHTMNQSQPPKTMKTTPPGRKRKNRGACNVYY